MTLDQLIDLPQYSMAQPKKEEALLEGLNELTEHHRRHCAEYARLLDVLHPGYRPAGKLSELPYLPVNLFKYHSLRSIPEQDVFKVLTSSGTTGQGVSRIALDRQTAQTQTLALSKIMTHVLGPARLPMILVESSKLIQDRRQFSARAAGLLGMINFGRNHFYALDEGMRLDESRLAEFLQKFAGQTILIFGFTFMVWQYLFRVIEQKGVDFSNAILVHSGGWKKLQDIAIGNDEFRRRFQKSTGLSRIFNFYGMVEQVGSVFLEGEDGCLYPPNFADIIIRDPASMRELPPGQPGIIQVLSLLPRSYPGHSLLTEDIGVVQGIDDSTCGRRGKRFRVLGRVAQSELRGCSDVHASQVA
jgi:phenylacetate-coenzyme A ligase PaaK-like adenylate-forming protein